MVVVGLLLSATVRADEKELALLEGTWAMTARESMGKKATEEEIKKLSTRLIVKGDKITVRSKDVGEEITVSELTFKLDPKTTPKSMDLTVTDGPTKGKKAQAIYELEGDTLKVCISFDDEKRPTKFAAPSDSEWMLLTYKRDKK